MAEIIEPVNKKIRIQEEDEDSGDEAEVIFNLNDRQIITKDGKEYVKWKKKAQHIPSEEDFVDNYSKQLKPIYVYEPEPVKRRYFPTIAPNYAYWADLIFEPGSRERGMVLIVEGTSRYCWCQPFPNKKSETIKNIIKDFIKIAAGRITSLVTDAGNEWAKIPLLSAQYGFAWYRKNVAVTGHGAMARLDRTVRTLRYFMQVIDFLKAGKWNWYECFTKAVEIFNKEPHSFSNIPPGKLIARPQDMHMTRLQDYQTWPNYADLMPYILDKDAEYYPEIDPENHMKRFRYYTFMKGMDRHVYDRIPRKIAYVIGNKFLLEGDPPTNDYLYDARQLLPVNKYKLDYKDKWKRAAAKIGKHLDGKPYVAKWGDEQPKYDYPSDGQEYNMQNF